MMEDAVRHSCETVPTWLFRAASHPACGGGHMRRCMVLSAALAPRAGSLFVLDRGGEMWFAELERRGIAAVTEGHEPDGLWAGSVLDGYDFGEDYAAELAARAAPLVVIDDLLRPPPAAHLVVNPAPGLEGTEIGGVAALFGSRYALVDVGFAQSQPPPIRNHLDHVLVSLGMFDRANATSLALRALTLLSERGFQPRVSVVLGPEAPHLAAIRASLGELGLRGRLRVGETDMIGLLGTADLMIGAGGVGLLERLASGVPSISITVADNQRAPICGAAALGGTIDAGQAGTLDIGDLADTIAELATSVSGRERMQRRARHIVDGAGARRVSEAMHALGQSSRVLDARLAADG